MNNDFILVPGQFGRVSAREASASLHDVGPIKRALLAISYRDLIGEEPIM